MSDELTVNQKKILEEKLFSYENHIYAIVDSALSHEIHILIQAGTLEYRNLYEGKEAELLEEAAPYLLKLKQGDDLTDWLFHNVYKKNAISFIQSEVQIELLAIHLRQYAKIKSVVYGDDGRLTKQWVFFAFYDPRVFPRFIQGNTSEQSSDFFKKIDNYLCENPDDKSLLESYNFLAQDHQANNQTINLGHNLQEILEQDETANG